ncbi:MAG: oxygenase MpaB family protein, partial [Janthinobacterium lividum]
ATLQAYLTMTFGDTDQARAIARQVGAQHARVRGTTRSSSPGTPAGTPYRATDPELALWVHATLVHTAREIAERYLRRPLPPHVREQHWQESKPLARMFGVTTAVLPGNAEQFQEYWDASVARLVVTDDARRIAADILTQRTKPPLPGVAALARSVTADLLPPRVADAYGLARTPGRRLAAAGTRGLLRTARPWLPTSVAWWPHARVARRRLMVAEAPVPALMG